MNQIVTTAIARKTTNTMTIPEIATPDNFPLFSFSNPPPSETAANCGFATALAGK
jgi:hypothetical protein